jgi:hypothetical protein
LRKSVALKKGRNMNLPLVKYYIQELHLILETEPNNPTFVNLYRELDTSLNSSQLKDIEAKKPSSDPESSA